MSRAFMKEGEAPEPRCPSCGTLGETVGAVTLEQHATPEDHEAIGDRALYCPNPACTTAYFNTWGVVVPQDRIKGGTYPKDRQAPICPCTGLRAGDVVSDARAGRKDRIKDLREKSEGPDSRCILLCPDGKSCVTRVMRLFRETFEAR
jgi:hypothetical protein